MAGSARDLRALLEAEREAGTFPSYQALVLEGERTVLEAHGGLAVVEPEPVACRETTLYDVASLTKPLVTALLALRLAEEGILALESPAAGLFPPLDRPPLDRARILDLLTHTAGLAAWAPLYLSARPTLADFATAAAACPPIGPPGKQVVYSDLGYIILGAILERLSGRPFVEMARRQLADLVPEDEACFPVRPDRRARTAATERGQGFERRMVGEACNPERFRTRLIWGETHDGNAWAIGGAAPHAGLFATARGVGRLASVFVEGRGFLGSAGRALARANLTPDCPEHRTAGFELASGRGTAATGVLPAGSFGHTGFTGTSVWIEAERRRIYVLLTNRVHPEVRAEVNMNAVRRRFHDAARVLS